MNDRQFITLLTLFVAFIWSLFLFSGCSINQQCPETQPLYENQEFINQIINQCLQDCEFTENKT